MASSDDEGGDGEDKDKKGRKNIRKVRFVIPEVLLVFHAILLGFDF